MSDQIKAVKDLLDILFCLSIYRNKENSPEYKTINQKVVDYLYEVYKDI